MIILQTLFGGILAIPSWSASLSDDGSFQDRCAKFKPRIGSSKLEFTEVVSNGQKANLQYRDDTCGGPGSSPPVAQDVCRVALYAETSRRSGIHLEIWLPADWSGRFLSTGNGGIGGCIDYSSIAYGTKHGFVVVGSNNGHNGTSGKSFLNNPDVVADFAGRSLHTITEIGKEVSKQFYGKPHLKSYFLGCSQGGRQGIGSAEKHPDDFDGIIAGACALDFTSLVSWRASFFPTTGSVDSTDFIKPSVWFGLIHNEILHQCDALDGVRDGIIESPDLCSFRPETLQCQGNQEENCLNENQIRIVRKIFAPLTYDDGAVIYPGMQPGSELRAIDRLYAGKPFSDSQDWFRYVVHSDPSWNPSTFTTSDARVSESLNPFNIKTYPSDLNSFRSNGGKIIMYHGLQDQQITSFISSRWYDHFLQMTNSSPEEVDEFLRYFRISGMFHCNNGPGAWMIGQGDHPVPFEGGRNVLAAIVDWVEKGIAPETIEGTKYVGDTASNGLSFTRKHCRYPKRNMYRGIVSINQIHTFTNVDDWECI